MRTRINSYLKITTPHGKSKKMLSMLFYPYKRPKNQPGQKKFEFGVILKKSFLSRKYFQLEANFSFLIKAEKKTASRVISQPLQSFHPPFLNWLRECSPLIVTFRYISHSRIPLRQAGACLINIR